MRNLTANFDKFLSLCNKFGKEFTNEKGNITRRDAVPKFSDVEVIALRLTAENHTTQGNQRGENGILFPVPIMTDDFKTE